MEHGGCQVAGELSNNNMRLARRASWINGGPNLSLPGAALARPSNELRPDGANLPIDAGLIGALAPVRFIECGRIHEDGSRCGYIVLN